MTGILYYEIWQVMCGILWLAGIDRQEGVVTGSVRDIQVFRRLYSRCTVYFAHVTIVCAQVSLRNFLSGISHFCGGSIIHPSWILTAGQSLHHGPNIFKDTEPVMSAFLKNWPIKVLGSRCLSVWGPDPLPPPVTHCMNTVHALIHTGKGGREVDEQREGWRGASSQEGSKIPTWLTVSPVYKFY